MDYNHRRANSELAAYQNSANASGRNHGQPQVDRHLRLLGSTTTDTAMERPGQQRLTTTDFARDYAVCKVNSASSFDKSRYANNNTNFHFRSQSYGSPYGWDAYLSGEPISAPPTGHSRYGSLVSSEAQQKNLDLAPSAMQRRGSESSTSSMASNCTATVDGASAWSASTTPETMSPTSPNNSILPQSPPERISSKAGLVVTAPASPSRANQTSMPSRPARARACSYSALKRFQNTPIESPVPEEEEQAESRRNSGMHQKRLSEEASIADDTAMSVNDPCQEEGLPMPNLHQRRQQRQQRQQKISGQPQAKQPVRLRLSPLPPLPLDRHATQTSSAASHQALKASRSMPQIRDAAGPPPLGPLPPLPAIPNLSPFAFPTLASCTVPSTPSYVSMSIRPPHPCVPPPPPPSALLAELPTLSLSCGTETLVVSATSATVTDKKHQMTKQEPQRVDSKPQEKRTPWEEELRRHKKLLEQFPSHPEEHCDLPKLSRAHRSLGNIRARSRSLSRATTSSHEDMAVGELRISQHASTFSLRGSKTQRPSTAKSSRDSGSRLHDPLPPLPQLDTPRVSVFEDDSDDEGDTVRKFVRNLFSRRTPSGEVPAGGNRGPSQACEAFSSGQDAVVAIATFRKASVDGNGHNSRMKNYSASSSFSNATTVGASTVISATTTIALTNTDICTGGCAVDYHLENGGSPSPRTSLEHSRPHQKGPLLSRMFVRRSH